MLKLSFDLTRIGKYITVLEHPTIFQQLTKKKQASWLRKRLVQKEGGVCIYGFDRV